jgi:hypothetical protein
VKFVRLSLCALAAVALMTGCGKSTNPTRVSTETENPTLDNTPPPVPSGLRTSEDPSGHTSLVWTESSASDVVGYEIYVYDPDPERETSYVLQYSTDASTFSYALDPADGFVTKHFRVRAVDSTGNRSAMTSSITVTVGPTVSVGGDPEQPQLPTMTP